MTVFTPLVSGVRGAADDDGHLAQRHQPFTHPMENAMSPEQWERLKAYLADAAQKLDVIAELRAENADIKSKIADALKENAGLKSSMADLEAKHADLEKAVADLTDDNAARRDAGEKLRTQLLDAEAQRDEATKNAIALVSDADKKDEQITVLQAQLKEARARGEEAVKALEDEKTSHYETKKTTATKTKDKSGGAH